jgi:hypothetical protein
MSLKGMLKKIKLFCGIRKRRFVWFGNERRNCYEIDLLVPGPDGKLHPPFECNLVPTGEIVKIYRSKKSEMLHACTRGQTSEWDKQYGVFCESDFDADNYEALGKFEVVIRQKKIIPYHQPWIKWPWTKSQ